MSFRALLVLIALLTAGCGPSTVPVNLRSFAAPGVDHNRPLYFLPSDAVFPGAPLELRGMYQQAVAVCAGRARARGIPVVDQDVEPSLKVALAWTVAPAEAAAGAPVCVDGSLGMSVCQASSTPSSRYRKGVTLRFFQAAPPRLAEVYVVSAGAKARSAIMQKENLEVLCEGAFRHYPSTGDGVVVLPVGL